MTPQKIYASAWIIEDNFMHIKSNNHTEYIRSDIHEKEVNYWKERCKAAEEYIDKTPCDPDIYPEQLAAY